MKIEMFYGTIGGVKKLQLVMNTFAGGVDVEDMKVQLSNTGVIGYITYTDRKPVRKRVVVSKPQTK